LTHPGKVLDFFAVLEVLKKSGRFPVLHWDGIMKVFSLIIHTKKRYMKE